MISRLVDGERHCRQPGVQRRRRADVIIDGRRTREPVSLLVTESERIGPFGIRGSHGPKLNAWRAVGVTGLSEKDSGASSTDQGVKCRGTIQDME
jgi:hypothetical protein